jgi:hypothetical protein
VHHRGRSPHLFSQWCGKQLRFELLQRLAADEERHLLLLTATPHSGDEVAFFNLLSLLNPAFSPNCKTARRRAIRCASKLARHFVQRRRKDIVEWQAEDDKTAMALPRRMKAELTYKLSGRLGCFFDAVQTYCRELAETVERPTRAAPASSGTPRWPCCAAWLRQPGRRSQGPEHAAGRSPSPGR